MPWNGNGNNQGSSGGGQNPWGRKDDGPKRSKPSGGSGPDFSELKRMMQNFGGSPRPGRGISWAALGLGLVALLAIWMASGIYVVDEGERGVVLRFGEPDRQTQPGLHYHLPSPIEEVILVSVEEQRRVEISELTNQRETTEILTGDESFVDIEYSITWRISNPFDYLFNIVDPELTIRAIGESTMREVIGERNFNEIIGIGGTVGNEKSKEVVQEEIKQRVTDSLQTTLNALEAGVEVRFVNITKILSPESVIPSVNAVQIAQSEARKLINQANAEANRRIPIARGEAVELLGKAKGEAAKVVAEAEGQAARFEAIQKEYKKSPKVVYQRLYTETMTQIFKNSDVTLIDKTLPGTILVPYGGKNALPGILGNQ